MAKITTLWHSRQGKDVLQNLLGKASIKEGFMEVAFMVMLERQASVEQDGPRAGREGIKGRSTCRKRGHQCQKPTGRVHEVICSSYQLLVL